MSKHSDKYNYAIIGSNLEALLVGAYLSSKGQSVILIDDASRVGGTLAPVDFSDTAIDSLATDIPVSEALSSALFSLSASLPFFDPLTEFNQAKISFEKGHFEPFVGFGENSPAAFDLFSNFLQESKLNLRMPLSQLFVRLSEGLKIQLNVVFSDALISDKKILSLTINEKERIEADQFIFTKNPVELLEILPKDTLTAKTVAKFSKFKAWATMNLILVHKAQITETKDLHVLYGTQKNPVVSLGKFGRVFNAASEPVFYSQWQTFLEQDTENMSEESVQALKEMKRQMKRAYPTIFDDLIFEKIALLENVNALVDLSSSKVFGTLSEIENLALCSHQMVSETTNVASGAVIAAEKTIAFLEASMSQSRSVEADSVTDSTVVIDA